MALSTASPVSSVMGPDGTLHVATYRTKAIVYYRWTEGAWSYKWGIYNIGLQGETSITLDRNAAIHIAYHGAANDLMYATNAGGFWLTFARDSTDDVGAEPDIAVDADGKVHIAYYDTTHGALKYASNQSGIWKKTIVDNDNITTGREPSIAVDAAGRAVTAVSTSTSSAPRRGGSTS